MFAINPFAALSATLPPAVMQAYIVAMIVLVADENADSRTTCEMILAKLHFAVAPVNSVEKAVAVIDTLRPDVIVAHAKDVMPLQRAAGERRGLAKEIPAAVCYGFPGFRHAPSSRKSRGEYAPRHSFLARRLPSAH